MQLLQSAEKITIFGRLYIYIYTIIPRHSDERIFQGPQNLRLTL